MLIMTGSQVGRLCVQCSTSTSNALSLAPYTALFTDRLPCSVCFSLNLQNGELKIT